MGTAFQSKNLTAFRRQRCGLDDELYSARIMKEASWILSGFPGVDFPHQLGSVSMVSPQIESKPLKAAEISPQAVVRSCKTVSRCLCAIDRGRHRKRNQVQIFHPGTAVALSHSDHFQGLLSLRQSRERSSQD